MLIFIVRCLAAGCHCAKQTYLSQGLVWRVWGIEHVSFLPSTSLQDATRWPGLSRRTREHVRKTYLVY